MHLVHVWAPGEVLEQRDDKGLYRALHEGRLAGLTGVDAPYEPPFSEEALFIDTSIVTADDAAQRVLKYVRAQQPHLWPVTRMRARAGVCQAAVR